MNPIQETMNYSPFEPKPESAPLYTNNAPAGGLTAYEFTDWRDETISWKKTCYLHAGLNATHTVKVKGPDTLKFLSMLCVNSFNKFPIGSIKQGITCDENGMVTAAGVLLRTGEEEVVSYWMINLLLEHDSGDYDDLNVEVENLTGQVFMYQIAGPVSIDVLEAACGNSLRDLKFLRAMDTTIASKPVAIYRLGMAGTLAYEVHGAIEDAHVIYNELYKTGVPFGMRRLGNRSYPMNHSENGFPQYAVHFRAPGDEALIIAPLYGSLSDDITHYHHNPFELNWGKIVKFDHDFVGKDALEKIAAENKRKLVTLEWNIEDIADVFISQFRDKEPYKYIESPRDPDLWFGGTSHDKVINSKGEMVGTSFGRQNSAYFQRMISICCLDTEYTEIDTEVIVVWGEPGTRQKSIRTKVARYPYNNVLRNESTDVSTLPKNLPEIKQPEKERGVKPQEHSSSSAAEDTVTSVAGKYEVEVSSPMGNQSGAFDYKVDGDILTGTATALGKTVEIYDGTVIGNTFTHYMKMKSPMGRMKIRVSGKVKGDNITGEFKMILGAMQFSGVRVE
jgi:glycine cleavage system aminomethyltransferase T